MESTISAADYRAIKNSAHKSRTDNNLFRKLIRKAKIIYGAGLSANTVQLNSLVILWHSILKKIVSIRIVLPQNADLHQRKISIFAPISMAVFGLRERASVRVQAGGVEKHLKIIKVINE